ncbi:MAG: leucine-rich repeat domain-containing protein [Candidatus Odinarchaeota archaeon]
MNNRTLYPHFNNKEVQVNRFISLKLEDDSTNIYVNKILFRKCKSLLINIPLEKIIQFDEIPSIEDLTFNSLGSDSFQLVLDPEEEFWGHCSNIQAWIENDYNTKILHHSLSFPLLKELCNLGDLKAKRVFKDEVITRFINGTNQVRSFLLEEGFLRDFSSEERDIINEYLDEMYNTSYYAKTYFSEEEIALLFDEYELIGIQEIIRPKSLSKSFTRKYSHLKTISDIDDIEELKRFTDITSVSLIQNCIKEIKGFGHLTYLRELALNMNEIKEIKNLKHLKYLKYLSLSKNQISEIKGLNNLTRLEYLNLSGNHISRIRGLECLKKLKVLNLWNNKIKEIEGIDNLTDLRMLAIGGNLISEIKGLENLKNLRVLILDSNRISELKGIDHLIHLKQISLYNNNISIIEVFPKLPSLREVSLRMNPISDIDAQFIQKFFGIEVRVYF